MAVDGPVVKKRFHHLGETMTVGYIYITGRPRGFPSIPPTKVSLSIS